jgi:hypothetical protein
MSNFTSLSQLIEGLPGTAAQLWSASTPDNLGTITATGYLNDVEKLFKANDLVYVNYSDTSTFPLNPNLAATFGYFKVIVGGGNTSLQATAPTGSLLASNNLSDLNTAATAVTNLGFAQAANKYAFTSFASPDAISELKWIDVPLLTSALASAGTVTIQASSGLKQYKVRDIRVNYSASGFSGGGGDRLVQITDGTTVYNNAGITAALLGTPVNTVWGGSGNPLPGTVPMDLETVAGQSLVAKYAGGTTDWGTGTVTISVLVERVA